MKHLYTSFLLLALGLSACAGTVVPPARMASTQAAIRSAREVGAEQEPTAALHLQYAREQYARADQLSQRGEGERAERLALRAQADAEYAMALSRRSAARANSTPTPNP